jgi:hypothetical protein
MDGFGPISVTRKKAKAFAWNCRVWANEPLVDLEVASPHERRQNLVVGLLRVLIRCAVQPKPVVQRPRLCVMCERAGLLPLNDVGSPAAAKMSYELLLIELPAMR